MRTQDEQHLVKVANDYINRLSRNGSYFPNGLGAIGEYEFFAANANGPYASKDAILRLISEMSDGTLGAVIGLGIVTEPQREKSQYRQTWRLVGLGAVSFDAVSDTGHDILVALAHAVILPTMYDILHAERVMREKESQAWRDTHEKSTTRAYSSWPKPAMKNFVREYRLRR